MTSKEEKEKVKKRKEAPADEEEEEGKEVKNTNPAKVYYCRQSGCRALQTRTCCDCNQCFCEEHASFRSVNAQRSVMFYICKSCKDKRNRFKCQNCCKLKSNKKKDVKKCDLCDNLICRDCWPSCTCAGEVSPDGEVLKECKTFLCGYCRRNAKTFHEDCLSCEFFHCEECAKNMCQKTYDSKILCYKCKEDATHQRFVCADGRFKLCHVMLCTKCAAEFFDYASNSAIETEKGEFIGL